jgi:1,4-dihydroxy-2-naphthoyl-CoA hydrolase
MPIWFQPLTIEYINKRNQNTLADFLGIEFIEVGEDFLKATMPASERTKQPLGIIHGGANVVLAETLASVAANSVVDLSKVYCVGLEINANHIRPVTEGIVTGITHPIHIGRTTHVWQVEIYNKNGKISCTSRMTASVITR